MTRESDHARLERLRAQAKRNLQHGKSPSLKATFNYYMDQAQNRDLPTKDRKVWKQLADEVGERIRAEAPLTLKELQETHDPLF